MFTGIVQVIGKVGNQEIRKPVLVPLSHHEVSQVEGSGNEAIMKVVAPKIAAKVQLGSSVSVNGVCLTVAKKRGQNLFFNFMLETRRKTTLGEKKSGDRVNLETSLRLGDEVGGHFVYGHVDGVGMVREIFKKNSPPGRGRRGGGLQVLFTIKPPQALIPYIVPQGAVAIDGVSLTVSGVEKKTFTVSLVPFTLKHTTLGLLKKGDKVNIEADMMAKYIKRMEPSSRAQAEGNAE